MTEPEVGWHGWSSPDNTAIFITPMPDGERVGLYLQMGRDTQLAAVFLDVAMASLIMEWLDNGLTATATANAELVRRLEHEQPLFAGARPSAPAREPEDDDDPEGLFS